MSYRKETDQAPFSGIDCYWEADLPAGGHTSGWQDGSADETKGEGNQTGINAVVFPSLPEPYINLFFHLGEHPRVLVKGLASQSAYFTMSSALFGVRLRALGWLRADLGPLSGISNRLTSADDLGLHGLTELAHAVASAPDFERRVTQFQAYVASTWRERPESRLEQIAEAIEHVIREFREFTGMTPEAYRARFA